jgi:hypothetical protein
MIWTEVYEKILSLDFLDNTFLVNFDLGDFIDVEDDQTPSWAQVTDTQTPNWTPVVT